MFSKQNLLDLIKSFTLFKADGNKMYKVVGRYQQFRAVKLILERHHGTIDVRSTVSKGTTFTIRLPLQEAR